jgi:PAS domain-containing protein
LIHVQERARRLAEEKSHLQLIIHMMERLSTVPGLDNTVDNMLRIVLDNIGGTNLIMYYSVDSDLFRADVFGSRTKLDVIEDDLVRKVFETRTSVQHDHDFSDTKMMTAEFTRAETWVYPLLVGPELIGVLKIEGIHVPSRDWEKVLPTFFNYAALVLKSEILGHTKLMRAHEQLRLANGVLAEEISERRQVEEALEVALVKYRTLFDSFPLGITCGLSGHDC